MVQVQASSSHKDIKALTISNSNPNSKGNPEIADSGAPKIPKKNSTRLLEDAQIAFTKGAEQSLIDNSESELSWSIGPEIATSEIGEDEDAHDTDIEVDNTNYHASSDQSLSSEVQEGVPAPEKLVHILQRR